MKKLVLSICALSIVLFSFGQSTVDKSKLQFNAGVGLSTWGIPVYLGADYWITPEITLGADASVRLWVSSIRVGASVNGNYHFKRILELPKEFDLYAGLSAGPYFGLGSRHFYFNIGGQVGGRYYFKENVAFHAELGGGTLSGGKAGLTFRF